MLLLSLSHAPHQDISWPDSRPPSAHSRVHMASGSATWARDACRSALYILRGTAEEARITCRYMNRASRPQRTALGQMARTVFSKPSLIAPFLPRRALGVRPVNDRLSSSRSSSDPTLCRSLRGERGEEQENLSYIHPLPCLSHWLMDFRPSCSFCHAVPSASTARASSLCVDCTVNDDRPPPCWANMACAELLRDLELSLARALKSGRRSATELEMTDESRRTVTRWLGSVYT